MRISSLTSRLLIGAVTAATVAAGVGTASATPTTYTSKSAFVAALSSGYYFTNFSGLTAFDSPTSVAASGGTPSISYSITAAGNLFVNQDAGVNAVGNFVQADDVIATFSSGNVYAVGADFYLCDINGNDLNGDVSVSFSNGASGTAPSLATGTYGFFGVIDTAGPITSMTVTHSDVGFLNLTNFYVGGAVVPEPTGLGLVAPLALGLIRRRRVMA